MKNIVGTLLVIISFKFQAFSQVNPNPSSALDAAIQSEMNFEKFPGTSTVIVKNGEIVWLESYGFADVGNNITVEDTTVFLLASMSKVFTGTAIMQLYLNGIIDLDKDINNYMGYTIDIPGFETDSITFRQLMTHTASIQDNGPVMDTYYDYPDPSISLSTCMARYFPVAGADYNATNNFHNNAPGTFYDYSNMGTALNGYMVEAATGKMFSAFCDSSIFAPLCMEKTSWFMADFDTNHVARPYQYTAGNYVPYRHYGFADYPDGQLRSNVVDLANFMIAYLDGGNFGTNSILTSSSVNQMLTVQNAGLDPTQGLNWYQEEIFYNGGNNSNMLWGHNGGEAGVSTDMYLDPVNNIGICVLTNGEGDALYICDELYDYAMSLIPSSSIVPSCLVLDVEDTEISDIQVYPNPASDVLHLQSSVMMSKATVSLTDAQGKLLQKDVFSGLKRTLDISGYASGMYFLSIQSESNTQSFKIRVK